MKLWFDCINGRITREREIQADHVEWVLDKVRELGKDWVLDHTQDFTLNVYLKDAEDIGGLYEIKNADEFRLAPNPKEEFMYYDRLEHVLCGPKRLRKLYKAWLPNIVDDVGLEEVVNSGDYTFEKYVNEWIGGMGSEFIIVPNTEYEEVNP